MLAGISTEIERLDYTIEQIRESDRPTTLDVPYMEACSIVLKAYRDLHRLREDQRADDAEGYLAMTILADYMEELPISGEIMSRVWHRRRKMAGENDVTGD